MSFDWPVYVALVLVLVLMALPIVSRRLHGPVEYVLPHDLCRRLDAGERITMLDIRSRKEFDVYHIAGATSVPRRDLNSFLSSSSADPLFRNRPVVLICQSDLDSTRTVRLVQRSGIDDVAVLKGGIFKWKRDHLPLERH